MLRYLGLQPIPPVPVGKKHQIRKQGTPLPGDLSFSLQKIFRWDQQVKRWIRVFALYPLKNAFRPLQTAFWDNVFKYETIGLSPSMQPVK